MSQTKWTEKARRKEEGEKIEEGEEKANDSVEKGEKVVKCSISPFHHQVPVQHAVTITVSHRVLRCRI